MVLGESPQKGHWIPKGVMIHRLRTTVLEFVDAVLLVYWSNSSAKWDNALLVYKLTFIPN